MSKLIFGCGYLGHRVAKLWRDAGSEVHVVTRFAQRAKELQSEGFGSVVADVANVESLADLPAVETVLFAVGFDRSAGSSIQQVYAGGVKNVLATLSSSVKQFIYISTTGVYGNAAGDWVDEATPPDPRRDGGKASLAAEQLLRSPPLLQGGARGGLASSSSSAPHLTSPHRGEEPLQAIILRLAGIYGPDRIPYIHKLQAGEPIAAPSEGWLNLIHVDDAAQIVLAAEAANLKAEGPHILNVSDGNPVVRGDYYREVARLVGAKTAQFVTPDADSPAAARAAANKRISNTKLREQLDYNFTYPSYREGLAAILG